MLETLAYSLRTRRYDSAVMLNRGSWRPDGDQAGVEALRVLDDEIKSVDDEVAERIVNREVSASRSSAGSMWRW